MSEFKRVYILGAGAIGLTLAVHLVRQGRQVTAVRTSVADQPLEEIEITLQRDEGQRIMASIEMVSLSQMIQMDGIIVVAAKSYANQNIAMKLKSIIGSSPIVILQNGLGVEQAFIDLLYSNIFRCILYTTSQKIKDDHYVFSSIAESPIGVISGDSHALNNVVTTLNTEEFPFCSHVNIQKEIWKKAIINSAFNSICPLIEVDNGVFYRDRQSAELAKEIVYECIQVTDRLKLGLDENAIMEQIVSISKGSDGQLISTLQDIMNGRETEIEFLNLAISRIAERLTPPVPVSKTKLLGKMVLLKSTLNKKSI